MPINGSDSYGDANTIPEHDDIPPNFKEYMLKEQLKWSRHEYSYSISAWRWVFWSEPSLSLDYSAGFNSNGCAIPKVEYNIRDALQKLMQQSGDNFYRCLVQFWAATTLEGRTKLTTQYQPFALSSDIWDGEERLGVPHLCEYRMKMCSSEYNNCFYADAQSGEQQLGVPGRVFLHKYPESTPRVEYYSKKEYPQLDDAIQCFIKESWAVPVFEHSSKTCVGVLEMVAQESFDSSWHDESFLRNMRNIFQEFGLIFFDGYTHCEMQCRNGNIKGRTSAFQELDEVLRSVCEIHCLPLAMTWAPCGASNDLLRGQLMCKVLECADLGFRMCLFLRFLRAAKLSHLRKGGLFERVLSSPCMLYCSDITQLSIVEYPFAHYARQCNFSGWFTICLQSSSTEKEVYLVDFFFPTNSKHDENILTTLSLILRTMEENLKTFKHASGQRLGEISLLQLGQLVQPSTDAIHGGMNVVREKQNYILPHQPSPHQLLDSSNNGHNAVIAEENISEVSSLEEGKRKTQRENKGTGVRIEVSLDDILKCARMKREPAAKKLKVSVSTFKRVCRTHGIKRWPPRNIEIVVGQFRPSPIENQGQTSQLNSGLPSNQAVPGIPHIKPGVQDANVVTFKAKYENGFIRFKLSSSSTLVEFQREVAKRLHLEARTYSAWYKDEGDLILIACDEDLQDCMDTFRFQGNTSINVVLLKPEEQPISLVESTRRDPSLFQHVESESKTKDVQYAICHLKTPHRLNMLKSEVADPICHSNYKMQFPEGIRNYIVKVKDVQADGNCGFRAIAALIGLDENNWKEIREHMLEELRSNSLLYEKVSGEKGRTEELCDRLDYFSEGPAPKDKWLTMPDMGHIIASAFRVVLVFLSDKQCLTFLPFYATPRPSSKRPVEDCVCSMGLVNNNHFVQLYMSPGSPMPSIASNWLKNQQPHAKGWSAPFCSRIEEFERIIGSDVATRETFDLIDETM